MAQMKLLERICRTGCELDTIGVLTSFVFVAKPSDEAMTAYIDTHASRLRYSDRFEVVNLWANIRAAARNQCEAEYRSENESESETPANTGACAPPRG